MHFKTFLVIFVDNLTAINKSNALTKKKNPVAVAVVGL